MRIGVIGCGNLGGSLIKGLLKSGSSKPKDIIASDPDEEKLSGLSELGVKTTTNNKETIDESDATFIAVKPDLVGEVLEELDASNKKLIVSVAAGVSTDFLEKHTDARVIRVMPNICGRVAEMASCFSLGDKTTKKDKEFIKGLLENLGTAFEVDEKLMDVVTGLGGSGPAFVYLVMEGLKDAGTELGLPEETALKLAAQTVKGSGEMVLDSEGDLEELIDMVSSPGGTTIEGVNVLKNRKVLEAFKGAVKAAAQRSEELSR